MTGDGTSLYAKINCSEERPSARPRGDGDLLKLHPVLKARIFANLPFEDKLSLERSMPKREYADMLAELGPFDEVSAYVLQTPKAERHIAKAIKLETEQPISTRAATKIRSYLEDPKKFSALLELARRDDGIGALLVHHWLLQLRKDKAVTAVALRDAVAHSDSLSAMFERNRPHYRVVTDCDGDMRRVQAALNAHIGAQTFRHEHFTAARQVTRDHPSILPTLAAQLECLRLPELKAQEWHSIFQAVSGYRAEQRMFVFEVLARKLEIFESPSERENAFMMLRNTGERSPRVLCELVHHAKDLGDIDATIRQHREIRRAANGNLDVLAKLVRYSSRDSDPHNLAAERMALLVASHGAYSIVEELARTVHYHENPLYRAFEMQVIEYARNIGDIPDVDARRRAMRAFLAGINSRLAACY